MYLGSWKIDDYLTFTCNTHTPSTGAVTDADAVPTYRVYEDETGTAIATGNTAKLDDANTTGYYSERIQLTAVAGYEKGKTYSIRVSATVGGVTGDMGHTFQIEAEVDSNIVSDKTGFGLAADQSTVTVGTVTTLTGHTAQTGDNYVRIGATGSGLTSLAQAATALTNLTWTDAKAGYIDHSIATVDTNVDTLLTRITAAVALASVCTETRLAELDAANLPTDIANVKTDTTAILEDTGTTIPDMMSAKIEDVMAVLGGGGDIYYVSKSGDNSDGTTWAKAKTTIDAAIALCTPNNADRIFVFAGTYDETANGATGVACDVVGIKIIGIMPGVVVKNTNTTNAGKVFSVTADDVWIHNMFATKGETTSDNSIVVDVDGAGISADIRDVTVAVEKASHTGIRFTGGAVGCGYVNGPMSISYIYSAAGVGTGIEAANCNNCVAIDAQFHTLTTGIKFTGGASCHDNMVSPNAMISSSTTGISLVAGCINNMLSALILNCTDEYDDNSGNNTNKTDGSLTYVLDDIKTHVDTGFDDVGGAGFVTGTDSLEAIRNRGDTAWTTATGFNTVVPDVAGTAAGLHTTTDGKVDAIQTDTTAIKAKTDNLPSGIAKNVALAGFNVFMVLSSDDKTAATGKTVSCTISKDGGAFSSSANSVVEISAGMYKIDLTQAEMNADVVTLRFTATDCNDRVITVYTS